MNKQKKILISILVFLTIILSNYQVFAQNVIEYSLEISENYIKYLELGDIENIIAPRMYDIPQSTLAVKNPLKLTRMLGSSSLPKYSLRTIIPENMVVKKQSPLNTCWSFSTLAALESNLAMQDYKNAKTPIVYDFSEKHMDYATTRVFLNDEINEYGFKREPGTAAVIGVPLAYLTNGSGAVLEEEMPFDGSTSKIQLSEVKNKNIATQVYDTIDFPSYSTDEEKNQLIQQMKEHIVNYGAIHAAINGGFSSKVYNNDTGALYCNDSSIYKLTHAVAIVGWDDEYAIENFVETNRPTNKGAWIIKNSWGENQVSYSLNVMKRDFFEENAEYCAQQGWTDYTQVLPDTAKQYFSEKGFIIEGDNAVIKWGDNGFMYMSYEDCNIYKQLVGIVNAQTEISYENIYQHDEFGGYLPVTIGDTNKIYLATLFDKQTNKTEYLTQVSVNAPEAYTCKVYVNPNGTHKTIDDLQLVPLKAGETETFDAGYHTIEFLEPLKINSNSFAVVLEIQGIRENKISVMGEYNYGEFKPGPEYAGKANHVYDYVTVESGKCFITTQDGIDANQWDDPSTMYTMTGGGVPNFDTTIKAFSTSEILESIEISTEPFTKTYIEGQDFDATGMVVKANYANGDSIEITDYSIQNGEDLQLGQTSVTIIYEGKEVTQPISVVENSLQSITIANAPFITEYIAGENFDTTGMVVKANYANGDSIEITDYIIQDGTSLKNGQTTVTIEYQEKTVTLDIIVKANLVESLIIKQIPNKVKYVAGQNFDKTGMIVEATYKNGMVKQVQDECTVQNGTNLQAEQTTVIIGFEGATVAQTITVEVKTVTAINLKTMPIKTEYIQNKEGLDLTGGSIEISYNDGTTEEMLMTSEQITVSGFNNQQIGIQNIQLTYQEQKINFDIEIKEQPKPVNSNFDNIQGNIKRIRVYYFTDITKEQYTIINMELGNIEKATENDKMEYYYYLSSNKSEQNISDWIKLNEIHTEGDKLSFEINSADVSNYDEISNSQELYLYVREVATKNEISSEVITSSLLLEAENMNIEKYVDGQKKEDVNSDKITSATPGEDIDNTLASGTIPNAGKNMLILFIAVIVMFIIGRISYLRYKDIQIK